MIPESRISVASREELEVEVVRCERAYNHQFLFWLLVVVGCGGFASLSLEFGWRFDIPLLRDYISIASMFGMLFAFIFFLRANVGPGRYVQLCRDELAARDYDMKRGG